MFVAALGRSWWEDATRELFATQGRGISAGGAARLPRTHVSSASGVWAQLQPEAGTQPDPQ